MRNVCNCDRLPVHHWPDQGDPDHTWRGERCPRTHRGADEGYHEAAQLLRRHRRQPEVSYHARLPKM